jgi:hypothetical protein
MKPQTKAFLLISAIVLLVIFSVSYYLVYSWYQSPSDSKKVANAGHFESKIDLGSGFSVDTSTKTADNTIQKNNDDSLICKDDGASNCKDYDASVHEPIKSPSTLSNSLSSTTSILEMIPEECSSSSENSSDEEADGHSGTGDTKLCMDIENQTRAGDQKYTQNQCTDHNETGVRSFTPNKNKNRRNSFKSNNQNEFQVVTPISTISDQSEEGFIKV